MSTALVHPLNPLSLRRRSKLIVPAGHDALPRAYVASALKNLERMASEDGTTPVNVVRGLLTSAAVPLIVAHIGNYGGRRRVGSIEEVLAQGATGQGGDRYPTNTLYAFDPRTSKIEKRYAVQGSWGLGRF